jgi:hypothetical protein
MDSDNPREAVLEFLKRHTAATEAPAGDALLLEIGGSPGRVA